jgi:hypothetical protein
MKKILFSALMACFALTASAQISEGAPSAKKYATGNRPTKGTFGLYVGAESDLFDRVTDRFAFNPLPIVNLKYMVSDNFELRLGMKFWKQRESLHFGNDKGDVNAYDEKYNAKAVVADNQFRPGFAYHFTKSNLLDVYAGIEGIVGWTRNGVYTNSTVNDIELAATTRTSTVQFGASAFIGLQAFIARLPLAIGLEYGVGTMWDGALRQKNYAKAVNGGNTVETTTYAQNDAYFNMLPGYAAGIGGQQGGVYDWMKARKGAWGSQIRLTLSYYFNR